MNPDSPDVCCAKRPGRYRGTPITAIPELSSLVKPVKTEPGEQVHYFVCTVCGQAWEDHRVPMMHVDVSVVVKAGVVAALDDTPPPRPPVPAPPPIDRSKVVDQRIRFSCVAAGIVIGFATLPPISGGVAPRQGWLILCVLLGAVAGPLLVALRHRKP